MYTFLVVFAQKCILLYIFGDFSQKKYTSPMLLVCVLFILILALGVFEAATHLRHVSSVPLRILVNGTRGKTTVTRQLYSSLSSCGKTVLAKATGSEARLIYPDGHEEYIKRRFGYHLIREQYNFFALALKLGVDAVVVECCAVNPESQLLMAKKLVKPTCSVITNARIDHVDQMGATVESTAETLKLSVPTDATFYTNDAFFASDPQAVVVEGGNEQLVKRVMADFGYENCTIGSCVPDIGLVGPFKIGTLLVVNAFAANDKQSASEVLAKYMGQDFVVLYNNRADREFRVPYFASLFKEKEVKHVLVLGEHVEKCVRSFSKQVPGATVKGFKGSNEELISLLGSKNCKVAIGMGNIKGVGAELIEYCQKEGSNA